MQKIIDVIPYNFSSIGLEDCLKTGVFAYTTGWAGYEKVTKQRTGNTPIRTRVTRWQHTLALLVHLCIDQGCCVVHLFTQRPIPETNAAKKIMPGILLSARIRAMLL